MYPFSCLNSPKNILKRVNKKIFTNELAFTVLRNVCLTRVRIVYLIRYNLPWRKITYFHFKYNILPITTLQRTICAKTLLIKEGESNMKVYRKTASIIRSDSYSSPRSSGAAARHYWHKG